jgi:thioredoxin-like negative regulator of GroEL
MDKSTKNTIVTIVIAIVILVAIVIFAKPGTKSTNNNTTDNSTAQTTTDQTTTESAAGNLGKNETNITAANFGQEVLKAPAGKLVIVDAYAPWCPHCQKMGPIFTSLADEYAGQAIFGKMNANNQDSTVKANFDYAVNTLGLQGYPTFWFYKDGKKVDEKSGELTKDEFKTEIEKYIK